MKPVIINRYYVLDAHRALLDVFVRLIAKEIVIHFFRIEMRPVWTIRGLWYIYSEHETC